MTLTPEGSKKDTVIDIIGSREERDALAKEFENLLNRMIFDINDKRMVGNIGAIQGTPVGGQTDPILYLKITKAIKDIINALKTDAQAVEVTFEPNEISKTKGDRDTLNTMSKDLAGYLSALEQYLVPVKVAGITIKGASESVFKQSRFEVKEVFDLAYIEGLRSGKRISELIASGEIVPEYGKTALPPVKRGIFSGSKLEDMNRAYVVVVEDISDETAIRTNPKYPVNIDSKAWKNFIGGEKFKLTGVSPGAINAYREFSQMQPKTVEEMLQMTTILALAKTEGLTGPRPILAPVSMTLEDPDIHGGNNERPYYIFTIGGYSSSRQGMKAIEQQFESTLNIAEFEQ